MCSGVEVLGALPAHGRFVGPGPPSSRRSASMISSKVTGRFAPGGLRKAGIDSTAQASDAHDDRMARFS